jgi:hypothetical protein
MLCFIASVDRQTFGAAALDRDVYVVCTEDPIPT